MKTINNVSSSLDEITLSDYDATLDHLRHQQVKKWSNTNEFAMRDIDAIEAFLYNNKWFLDGNRLTYSVLLAKARQEFEQRNVAELKL
ncbi:hypothetical protein HC723_15685 [Vibrio sp. S11_S32]|uniref:hypothetical protein n=1 Tax=Vibrio sp. S11_S32 TaxID=2720225 RepID=UPI0016819DDE|nr:hypothetical protein [Vibrio sp. S11_S32]MBD1577839.1 hypothetical protein [Vibrio sp. S11_S32]